MSKRMLRQRKLSKRNILLGELASLFDAAGSEDLTDAEIINQGLEAAIALQKIASKKHQIKVYDEGGRFTYFFLLGRPTKPEKPRIS